MTYTFRIHFNTSFGEQLQLQTFRKGKKSKTYALSYENAYWSITLKNPITFDSYSYQMVRDASDEILKEWGNRDFHSVKTEKEVIIYDQWNKPNYPENYLLKPFFIEKEKKYPSLTIKAKDSHVIGIKAAVGKGEKIVISGNTPKLGNWNPQKAIPLKQTDYGVWQINVALDPIEHTIQYKFGIESENGIQLEEGSNRTLPVAPSKNTLVICQDAYFKYSYNQMPKKAGVAIPVFSIRTEDSMGIGEFSDMKKMGDWMQKAGLSVLQILPINDTIAQHNWNDCYPYAAISVYALNPFYISIAQLHVPISDKEKEQIKKDCDRLNQNELVDLDAVMESKWKWLKTLFTQHKTSLFKDKKLTQFIQKNKDWLAAYTVFCVLRDENKTADFTNWKTLSTYNEKKVNSFFKPTHKQYEKVLFYAWIQYELDAQLTNAIDYLHQQNIKVKGDLPIGIFRHSVEAWKEPELFGMDFQAGAPPDDFAVLGQNWEFPTYNWELMQQDGLLWWKSRFQALNQYFDAMRIDHILGFFRIWRIPKDAVQGIMGYFYPAIPITEEELYARGIHYYYDRFCLPFINEEILHNQFGDRKQEIADHFLDHHQGHYGFKEAFNTQRKMQNYLVENAQFQDLQPQLMYLLSNVLLLPESTNEAMVFHPRFNFASTESFKHLAIDQQQKLHDLYNDYYFQRQDGMWQQSAMEKLPDLLEATDMLICGEDLGLVPKSVPLVMNDLAILSLQVQRMTNDERLYSDPAHAPYLSVVTPGTHDTSTVRQWWKEDRYVTQHYYNHQLHRFGEAPHEANSDIIRQIILQHLHSPAMLTVVPVQEWMTIQEETTNPNVDVERINIPAVFPHYWRYRMHISMEDLMQNDALNQSIASHIQESGRI